MASKKRKHDENQRPLFAVGVSRPEKVAETDLMHSEDESADNPKCHHPIPESYWRELAEERRLSLAEALSENEALHHSIEELKEENKNLSHVASQADYLASVLNNVLGDQEESEETDKPVEEGREAESGGQEAATATKEGVVSQEEGKDETSDSK